MIGPAALRQRRQRTTLNTMSGNNKTVPTLKKGGAKMQVVSIDSKDHSICQMDISYTALSAFVFFVAWAAWWGYCNKNTGDTSVVWRRHRFVAGFARIRTIWRETGHSPNSCEFGYYLAEVVQCHPMVGPCLPPFGPRDQFSSPSAYRPPLHRPTKRVYWWFCPFQPDIERLVCVSGVVQWLKFVKFVERVPRWGIP